MFRALLFSAFFLLGLAVSSCQSCTSNTPQSKYVKINLKSEPTTLDPRLARDLNSVTLMKMFFEGLTRIGPKDEPELALARSVEISEDLKTYSFTLRDAYWSNGDPVRAREFVSSFRKMLSPSYHSDNASQFYVIKNGKEVKLGNLKEEDLGVYAPNDQTLVIELEYPIPYFLQLLASPYFFPVHEVTDEQDSNWATKVDTYVSNGPFVLSEWKHHDRVIGKKNLNYWDEKSVQLDGIEMIVVQEDTELKLFDKNRLHWVGSPLSTISIDALNALKQKGLLHVKETAGTGFIRVNTEAFPMSHPKIRKALSFAIHRADLVEHVTQGGQLPATSLVPPNMMARHQGYFQDADIERAKALFEEGLKELNLKVEEFPQITLTYASSERAHLIAQAVQAMWREVFGIKVQLEGIELKIYFDKVSKQDYQMAIGSWIADFNDPINFLEVFKYRSQSTNNTHWEDPEYIQLINDSFKTLDPLERQKLLQKCEGILLDSMPIIPLFHFTMLYLKDEKLKGAILTNMGGLDFKWATLEN